MFKKVVSKALLSVVMDKKARSKLDAAKARAEQTPAATAAEPQPASSEELRAAARQALDQAEKELASKPKPTADRPSISRRVLARPPGASREFPVSGSILSSVISAR